MPNQFIILNDIASDFPSSESGRTVPGLLESALLLVRTNNQAPLPAHRATRHRTVTKRGVIWLGQTCNLHCDFCYFIDRVHDNKHPEHAFMPLAKAKEICGTLRTTYGNTAIDIEGGEPTLYPQIRELAAFCVEIGLYPTLITNAIVLDDGAKCRSLFEAGVRDFKISVHGLGEVHDRIVEKRGAHKRQMAAIANMREIGIPFRFNTVLTPAVLSQLPDIARLAVETGALCVNWLGYNPHEDQIGKTNSALIPNFTELRGYLTEALDILAAAHIESNARYIPACMLEPRHRESAYDYQQLFYDHREWDLASWGWTTLPAQRTSSGAPSDPVTMGSLRWWTRLAGPVSWLSAVPFIGPYLSIRKIVNNKRFFGFLQLLQRAMMRAGGQPGVAGRAGLYNRVARLHAKLDCRTEYEDGCRTCAARNICSGILLDYHQTYGVGEVRPIGGAAIEDPTHYIGLQSKLIESEDECWADSGCGI